MPRWTVYWRIMFVTPKRMNRYIETAASTICVVAERERLKAADQQHRA